MGYSAFSKFGRISRDYHVSSGRDLFVLASGSARYNRLLSILGNDEDGVARLYTTVAAALAVAVAGDVVYVCEGHTETITAALAPAAGVRIVGLGVGLNRPQITVNGAIDGVSLATAGSSIENIHFPAPGTDNQTAVIDVSAAGCVIKNITAIGSQTAKNVVDMITLASGANDCVIENVDFKNATVAVNSFLSIEAAVARLKVKNFRAFGEVATGGIIDAAAATQVDLEDVVVGVTGTAMPAATLDSNPTGMARNCTFFGTHTTLATNANLGNAMRLDNIKVLEETDGSKSAAIIPAVDVD